MKGLVSIMSYKILKILGEGGMGKVYQALDTTLNRIVAIKAFHENIVPNEKAAKRFLRESQICASLDHPNIIKVYQFTFENNRAILVMEYIEGECLLEYIKNKKPSQDKILEIFAKIIEAVHYAHRKQIIHRDIKPTNIIVRDNGEPVLMDFGIAKAAQIEDLTRTGELVGTPQYMSPEQASGERHAVDHRADIYSLGVILYQILTEKLPITATTLSEMLENIATAEIILPREYNQEMAPNLEQICMKSLCRDKEKRYATAKEFAEDLYNFQQGKKIKAEKFIQKQKWQKYFAKVGIIAGIFIAILAFFYATINFYSKPENTFDEKKLQEYLNNSQIYYSQNSIAKGYSYLDEFSTLVSNNKIYFQENLSQCQANIEKFLHETYSLSLIYLLGGSNEEIIYLAKCEEIAKKIDLSMISQIRNKYWKLPISGQMTHQINSINEYLIKDSNWPVTIFKQALQEYKSYQYEAAVQNFELLRTYYLNFQPQKPIQKICWEYAKITVAYYLGLCYVNQRKFASASNIFLDAQRYWKGNNFVKFIEEHQDILQKSQKFESRLPIRKLYANILIYLGTSFIGDIPYTNDLTSDDKVNYSNLVSILEELTSYEKNISEYSEEWALLQEFKARIALWKKNDETYINKENKEYAINLITTCLENNPMRFSCYLIRGTAYLELKEYKKSFYDFDYASKINPEQIESLSKIFKIIPYYPTTRYESIENIVSILHNWWVRADLTIFDFFGDDISKIQKHFRTKWQEQENSAISINDAEKFYSHLFGSEELSSLATNSFLSMQAYSQTLEFLENKKKEINNNSSIDSFEKQKKLTKISELIFSLQEKDKEKFKYQVLYLLSMISYQNRIPEDILEEFTKNPKRLYIIHRLVFDRAFQDEWPSINNLEEKQDWLKLYYLGARVLAHIQKEIPQEILPIEYQTLPSYQKYYRPLLLELVKKENNEILKIILLRALQDITYFSSEHREFIWQVSSKQTLHKDPFIEMIYFPLLFKSEQKDTQKKFYSFFQQCSSLAKQIIVYTSYDIDNKFFEKRLYFDIPMQNLWEEGLSSSDYRLKMLSIINTKKIFKFSYTNEKIWPFLQPFFFDKNPLLQKAALVAASEFSEIRKLNFPEFQRICWEILKKSDNSETKRMAVVNLLRSSDDRIFEYMENQNLTFLEKVNFFFCINSSQINISYAKNFFNFFEKNIRNQENSIMLTMFCYFFHAIQTSSTDRLQRNILQSFFENLIISYLDEDDYTMRYWSIISSSKIDDLSPRIWQKIASKIGSNQNKILDSLQIGALLNIAVRQPNYQELVKLCPQWKSSIMEKAKTPQNYPQELYYSMWFYWQILQNNKNNYFAETKDFITNENPIAMEERFFTTFETEIFDPDFLFRAKYALETMLEIGKTMGAIKDNEYGRSRMIKMILALSKVYKNNNEIDKAQQILETENLHKENPQIALAWLQLKFDNSEQNNFINNDEIKIWWKNWQNQKLNNCRDESIRLQIKAFLLRKEKKYNEAIQTLKQAHILCPEDNSNQIDLLEVYFKEQADLKNGEIALFMALYHAQYKSPFYWYRLKYYDSYTYNLETFIKYLEYLAYNACEYPITFENIQSLGIPKDQLGYVYYSIGRQKTEKRQIYHAIFWFEKAYQEGYRIKDRIPEGFEIAVKRALLFPKFSQIWRKIYTVK